MQTAIRLMIAASAVGFLMAVGGSVHYGEILGAPPEAFSRASSNLALLAIALGVSEGAAKRAG